MKTRPSDTAVIRELIAQAALLTTVAATVCDNEQLTSLERDVLFDHSVRIAQLKLLSAIASGIYELVIELPERFGI